MEIIGKVIARMEAQSGKSQSSGNEWMTQEYVIETTEQYPKRVCFKIFGEDKLNQFRPILKKDALVKVYIDINAREYKGRWYNDIQAWKVESADQAETTPTPAAAPEVEKKEFSPAQQAAVDNLKKTFNCEEKPVDTDNPQSDDLPF